MALDRSFIDNFLKINGVSAGANDAEIRDVLTKAKWNDEEIQTAILILRESASTTGIVAVTKHSTTLFAPTADLSSRQLSRLLGVDVIVDPSVIKDPRTGELASSRRAREEFVMWTIILLLSSVLAIAVLWILLFTLKLGPYRDITHWAS